MVVEQGLPVRVGLLLVSQKDLDDLEGKDEKGEEQDDEEHGHEDAGGRDDDDGDDDGLPPQVRVAVWRDGKVSWVSLAVR